MALTKAQVREILTEAGVEKENIKDAVEKIIDGHLASIDVLREEADTHKADAERIRKELDDLKAAGDGGWKKKHDDLKAEYDKYKSNQEAKETRGAKEAAVRALMKEVGISEKRLDSVLKVYDVDGVELDDKGALKGADKLKDAIKTEWADFITTTMVKGADIGNPPTNTGGATLTKADIYAKDENGRYKMSTSERQRAIAANPEIMKG